MFLATHRENTASPKQNWTVGKCWTGLTLTKQLPLLENLQSIRWISGFVSYKPGPCGVCILDIEAYILIQCDISCCLLQEFDNNEDKKEILPSKSKDKLKDDRRDKERSKTSEDGDRRPRSRDPDDQTQTSRSISPLKQVPWDFVYLLPMHYSWLLWWKVILLSYILPIQQDKFSQTG